MPAGRIHVQPVNICAEVTWAYRDGLPVWRHRQHGAAATFDPFPAYPHDLTVIEEAARHVEACTTLMWDVEMYVADREAQERTNGFSALSDSGHYEGDTWVKDPTVGLIMLSGKRIPPHPAMSRYLVAHEMGHNVEWMLNKARGEKHAQTGSVIAEYAKLRGLSTPLHAGSGGRWHDAAEEVFACDFRIVVCNVETEYWPHPGVPHPRDLSLPNDLWSWWADALETLKTAANTTPEE